MLFKTLPVWSDNSFSVTMTDVMGVSSLKEALPDVAQGNVKPSTNGYGDAALVNSSGWTKPQAYDYTAMEGPDRVSGWDGSARIYEWDGEEGDVGPEHPELEIELFGRPEDRGEIKGLDFTAYNFALPHPSLRIMTGMF